MILFQTPQSRAGAMALSALLAFGTPNAADAKIERFAYDASAQGFVAMFKCSGRTKEDRVAKFSRVKQVYADYVKPEARAQAFLMQNQNRRFTNRQLREFNKTYLAHRSEMSKRVIKAGCRFSGIVNVAKQ